MRSLEAHLFKLKGFEVTSGSMLSIRKRLGYHKGLSKKDFHIIFASGPT